MLWIFIQDKEGSTALHLAAKDGYKGCVWLLTAHGTDVNVKTNAGRTPLHEAVKG